MTDPRRGNGNACLLAAWLWALSPAAALSQDETGVDEAAPEPPAAPSQETDISEDNYRSFMELRDQALRRVALPTPQSPDTGLEKMGRLPEASQRHLRNQLREIITTRGPWTPEAVNDDYPFVPSPAARGDGTLRRQEAEAWSELVAGYHEREAEIAAGRARTGAATMSGAALGAGGEAGAGGAASRDADTGTAGSPAAPRSVPGNAASTSQATGSDPRMNEGVSQSALEFLTGQAAGSATGEAPGNPEAKAGSAADASAGTADAADTAAQAERRPDVERTPPPRPRPVRPGPPEEGASESALEYLAGEARAGDRDGAGGGDSEASGPATLSLEALREVPGLGPAPQPEPEPEPELELESETGRERPAEDRDEG